VLQLSDLHIGRLETSRTYDQDTIREKLLDDSCKMAELLGPPDLILVTGDISDSRHPTDEFWQAAAWITRMRETLNAGRDRLFLIPGNHDVNAKALDPGLTREVQEALQRDPSRFDACLEDKSPSDQQSKICGGRPLLPTMI